MTNPSPLDEIRRQLEILRPGQGRLATRDNLLGRDFHLSSIELARLAGGIRRSLGGAPIPFHKLLGHTGPGGDIPLGRLADFLAEHLSS
jgi:hypothetical protein